MCVSLVCVLVLFRASVCAFRVSELLVVRLSFVAKLFSLRSWFRSFRVEFRIRISRFVALFDFSNLDFCVEFRIRLFRFVALFDFSNFNFRFEFRVQVPWIFVSNFEFVFFVSLLYSTSRISLLYSTSRISLLYSTSRISLLYSISRISSSRFKCLEFRIRLFASNLSSKFSMSCSIRLLEFRFVISICDFDSKLWWSSSSRSRILHLSS